MSTILALSHVAKSFGKVSVLKNLSLKMKEGETIGLIGPSGCGKSTVFRIILGYYAPDEGSISFRGKKLNIKKLRRIVGYTTQDDSFYAKLTVMENMMYYARLYSVRQKNLKKHVIELLKDVQLAHAKDQFVSNLSGGMRRRLNFAISLVHDPELLIMDEPTTGLDPLLVEQFWSVVNKVKKKGKTVLVSSHILDEIEQNCDRVALMANGRIQKIIKPHNVLAQFRKL
ncbi:ATP-binding cassette domain-containing protein [Candidatus Woesearchaeota archaeon]|nr:ATP-binding cassette domain-containing protein [Candidatus Woesearchaeota archaeon]